jgi:hypothetical protein
LICRFIGTIKRNTNTSRVLVHSTDGKYYSWEADNERVDVIGKDFAALPLMELTLATPRQIEVGRGTVWKPKQSKVMGNVIYHGVVSGGKVSKTILVTADDSTLYKVISVPVESLVGLQVGDTLSVDYRRLFTARVDQVEAGLGRGKLRRKKRLPVQ